MANAITGSSYMTFVKGLIAGNDSETITISHINQLVPQITVTYGGSANCAYPSDCTGMVHAINASVTFNGKTTTKSMSGPYSEQMSLDTVGVGDTCDALIDPSSELCQGTIEGSATCSDEGDLGTASSAFQVGPPVIPNGGFATTGLQWNGSTSVAKFSPDETYCGTSPWCTPLTTPTLCPGAPSMLTYEPPDPLNPGKRLSPAKSCAAAAFSSTAVGLRLTFQGLQTKLFAYLPRLERLYLGQGLPSPYPQVSTVPNPND